MFGPLWDDQLSPFKIHITVFPYWTIQVCEEIKMSYWEKEKEKESINVVD